MQALELRPVPGHTKEYSVTPTGEVFGHFRKAFLKPTICNKGYYRFRLSSANKKFSEYAHRLVALAYIPNPQNKKCVNHKDCDTLNNSVDNLEWCTHKENMAYAARLGRMRRMVREDNPNFILTDQNVDDIKRLLKEKVTQVELAKRFNCSQSLISKIKRDVRSM